MHFNNAQSQGDPVEWLQGNRAMKANPMTKTKTKKNPPPRVMIRRSWMVVSFCENQCGEYGVDDMEFCDPKDALDYALNEAERLGVELTYGIIA